MFFLIVIAIIFIVTFTNELPLKFNQDSTNGTKITASQNNFKKIKIPKKLTNSQALKPATKKKPKRQIYDKDPVVNEYIFLSKYQNCMVYFKPVKSLGVIKVAPKKYTKKQQKRLDEFFEFCEQEKIMHPSFFEKDIFSTLMNVNQAKAQSPLGELIAKEYVARANQELQKIYQTLKKGHPNIMLNAINLLGIGFTRDVFYPSLEEILRTHDAKHIKLVADYAQKLYACNYGADCGENSSLMINYCKLNEDFCVTTYKEMLKDRLSFAQQADIKLVYQVYSSFFDKK